MGQAKGSNMVHMRSWVIEHHGTDAWVGVIRRLEPADREQLEGLVAVGWYPIVTQHRLLRAIDAEVGKGDLGLVPIIGEWEAEQDLTRIHRLFLRLANPAFVLEKARDYWARFYDTGRWRVERMGERAAHGALEGMSPPDEVFCRYLHGYMRRMFELVGAEGPVLTHPQCVVHGDRVCEWDIRWH